MASSQNLFYINLLNANKEVSKDISSLSQLVYAEDLVIEIAKELDINPIGRHLFSLYHVSNKLWLASNEKLSEWKENKKFEFRLRFRPYSLARLKEIDPKAFRYYFYQIRNDFINAKYHKDVFNKLINIIYGLAVTDMLRHLLENDVSIQDGLDSLDFSQFLPAIVENKRASALLLKNKWRESLLTAWNNSNKDIGFVMQEFMETFVNELNSDYGSEYYTAISGTINNLKKVYVNFHPYNGKGISISTSVTNTSKTEKICDVADLCFISIQPINMTVEISRKNGIPCCFQFPYDLQMKSFVSLLDGYYRFSEKWCFNICKEIISPSLLNLKSMKCHGPVGCEFAFHKLEEKSKGNPGTYILRESMSHFDEYKLDVIIRKKYIKTIKIKIEDKKYLLDDGSNNKPYESLSDLLNYITIKDEQNNNLIILNFCIPSSEYDQPNNLLLCKPDIKKTEDNNLNLNHPYIISYSMLKPTNTNWIINNKYCVRLATLQNEKVVVKEIKDDTRINDFLKQFSDWTQLRFDTIVVCKGITLYNPLSIVMEYLPTGRYDLFLIDNQLHLKIEELIESVTYLARAIWYLQEHNVIHGHIRCHNLLVSHYSENSLKIKLSDPISDHGIDQDYLWLSPEYLERKEYTPSLDVWSFGTTVWQIFNFGDKPDCKLYKNVKDLSQPFSCPDEVWFLINECWHADPSIRKQPQSIVRDISQILYEAYNSRRRINNYTCLNYTKKSNILSKSFRDIKSIFGSTSSLSGSSMISAQTEITFMTGNETSLTSDLLLEPNEEAYDFTNFDNNELPWVIDSNQLKVGKLLGQGCYGEVMMAVLTQYEGLTEEKVAVKRIKSFSSGDALRDMKREIEIMIELHHRNIVEIKGFVKEPQIMLVMEYVELGSLVTYLKLNQPKRTTSPLPLITFALDIANGMEYLESKSIVHRDLAARNILVASENHVKISDFGLAQIIDSKDQYYRIKTQRELPLRWYAPESLKFGRFEHKSDVWSYGVVLWEMYSYGENPVYPENVPDGQLLEAIESGKRLHCPNECSTEMYQLMLKCWRLESNERLSFTEIKQSIQKLMS